MRRRRAPAGPLDGVARLLNALLAHDEDTRGRLRALAGRVFAIELRGPGRTIYVLPGAAGVALAATPPRPPDVRLAGTPLALLALARRSPDRAPAGAQGVDIAGDLAAAQALQALAARIDIDWEELLARRIGDVAAHRLGRLARGLRAFVDESRTRLAEDTAAWLRDEAELTPDATTVEEFMAGVDAVRDDVERLEARVRRLAAARGTPAA